MNAPVAQPNTTANRFDVVALGEVVIDFASTGFSPVGNPTYEQHAGGAAANVATAVAKLGGRAAFIGAVGDDQFGRFLRGALCRHGVDDRWLATVDEKPTTLAFVHLDASGERSFTVLGFPGAESRLSMASVDSAAVLQTRALHLSSAILYAEPARSTAIALMEAARQARTLTSFDVNYREGLWSKVEARALASRVLGHVDVLKVAEDELELLTGTRDLDGGTRALLDLGPSLIAVTRGAAGSYYATRDVSGDVPGVRVDAVDTNGAGDAFVAALLFCVTRSDHSLRGILDAGVLDEWFRFANAAGAHAASRPGAMSASPTLADLTTAAHGTRA